MGRDKHHVIVHNHRKHHQDKFWRPEQLTFGLEISLQSQIWRDDRRVESEDLGEDAQYLANNNWHEEAQSPRLRTWYPLHCHEFDGLTWYTGEYQKQKPNQTCVLGSSGVILNKEVGEPFVERVLHISERVPNIDSQVEKQRNEEDEAISHADYRRCSSIEPKVSVATPKNVAA